MESGPSGIRAQEGAGRVLQARWDVRRTRRALALALLVGLGAIGLIPVVSASPGNGIGGTVKVIVQLAPGSVADPAAVVGTVGGTLVDELPIIDGFSALVPSGAVEALSTAPDVVSVSIDARLHLDRSAVNRAFAANDFNNRENGADFADFTMDHVGKVVGTDKAHTITTGAGVDVALIDSGVAPVAGIGPTVNGPDLSFDSQSPDLLHVDTFGHGTHMAGIINGNGLTGGGTGIAPDARVVSVKVASSDGATDVSQVIAAIDWVVQHRNTDGLNIRVLNLSFGTDGVQPYALDPLAYAAEVAWRKGIVVVVSAGNMGLGVASLTNPAIDPYVIAVGASEPNGTFSTSDDNVAAFTNRGNALRHPDVVAPGRSVVSLQAPGSYVAAAHPEVAIGSDLFRGSGTSQAAAVVSGAAALLVSSRPNLTPDQVKAVLMGTARGIGGDWMAQGAGQINVGKALGKTPFPLPQVWPVSTGIGSLEAARGTAHVVDGTGVPLVGEMDIFGIPWNGQSWSGQSWSGQSWSGGAWLGQSWSGQSWSGQSWSGQSWSGQSWSGQSWSGQSWSGQSWSGQSWSGQSWSGQSWSGQSWSGQAG